MDPRYEMPHNLYFGGGLSDGYITPLTLSALMCAVLLIFVLSRRYVLVPFLVAGLLLHTRISFVIAGFHFLAFRVLLLAGWARVVLRREANFGRINPLDKILLAWALYSATIFCFLWGWEAVGNRFGFLYTTLGSYFLLRFLIRDKADLVLMIKTMTIVCTVLAAFMLHEHLTGHNLLSVLGASELSELRNGQFRSQGPFLHSIIAGTLGGMMLAPFVSLWWQGGRNRWFAVLGGISSAVMTICSSSSTPAMTLGAGLLGLFLWPARRWLRWLRWGVVLLLGALHLTMKAPVWFLIARVGTETGGSGWHRATLIDMFVRHFAEWCLYGTRNNADWGYYMWDVDNAFVNNGVEGGLLTFALFIAIFVCAFKLLGKARKKSGILPADARLIWGIGCAIFANAVAFFGIFYFDQSILAWYGLLAMAAATRTFVADRKPERIPDPALIGKLTVSAPSESHVPISALFLQP